MQENIIQPVKYTFEEYLRENIREWIRQLNEDKSKESVETILNRMKNVVVE
tara:strand:+ start:1230 stop:1382 length:153 start_codon:yes stop_codon:yes gene_type:complete